MVFVISCGFFAVPCLTSHASNNHSENFVTTASSVDGLNQNQEDSIKQSFEEIFQECKTNSLLYYTSQELSKLWNEVNKIDEVLRDDIGGKRMKGYERFDGVFYNFCCWTGKSNCYPYDYVIKEIFGVTDEIGYINVVFKCQDIYDEPLDDVEVTVKMKYEKCIYEWSLEEEYKYKWVVDNVYNFKQMLREFIKSGKKYL